MLLSARKDLPIAPSTKMKQLQWDKLPQQQVSKTLWKDEEPDKENEMLKKLQSDGVWTEMEEDFKAKQLVMNLMGMAVRCYRYIFLTRLSYSQAKTCRTEECPRSSDKEARW
jgi:cytokinesis protein